MSDIEPGSRMLALYKDGKRLAIASEDPRYADFVVQKQKELGGEIGYAAWDRSVGLLVRVDEAMFPYVDPKGFGNDPMHELKTWPEPFQAAWEGRKTHEVRVNDRPGGFTTEDLLILREWNPGGKTYSGRTLFAVPTYITPGGKFGLPDNMVVMSIRVIAKNQNWKP